MLIPNKNNPFSKFWKELLKWVSLVLYKLVRPDRRGGEERRIGKNRRCHDAKILAPGGRSDEDRRDDKDRRKLKL